MMYRRQLKPQSTAKPVTVTGDADRAKTQDTLARTIWGEARGETLTGMEAVANVVLNRYKLSQQRGKFWWGNSVEEICLMPLQFSCWNADDPNYKKITTVNETDQQFVICQRIARRALNGVLPDHTLGADHYFSGAVTPSWAEGRAPTIVIGHHAFYQLEK
jgi:N-acetylmuramoyl-L-alanine amidase